MNTPAGLMTYEPLSYFHKATLQHRDLICTQGKFHNFHLNAKIDWGPGEA